LVPDFFSSRPTFFDTRIVDTGASSNALSNVETIHAANERSKRKKYEDRIHQVEHGDFCPLVFSIYGGLAPATQKALSIFVAKKLEFEPEVSPALFGRELHVARAKLQMAVFRAVGEMVYPPSGRVVDSSGPDGHINFHALWSPKMDLGWWVSATSFAPTDD